MSSTIWDYTVAVETTAASWSYTQEFASKHIIKNCLVRIRFFIISPILEKHQDSSQFITVRGRVR